MMVTLLPLTRTLHGALTHQYTTHEDPTPPLVRYKHLSKCTEILGSNGGYLQQISAAVLPQTISMALTVEFSTSSQVQI